MFPCASTSERRQPFELLLAYLGVGAATRNVPVRFDARANGLEFGAEEDRLVEGNLRLSHGWSVGGACHFITRPFTRGRSTPTLAVLDGEPHHCNGRAVSHGRAPA